jgi:hypothetical protein
MFTFGNLCIEIFFSVILGFSFVLITDLFENKLFNKKQYALAAVVCVLFYGFVLNNIHKSELTQNNNAQNNITELAYETNVPVLEPVVAQESGVIYQVPDEYVINEDELGTTDIDGRFYYADAQLISTEVIDYGNGDDVEYLMSFAINYSQVEIFTWLDDYQYYDDIPYLLTMDSQGTDSPLDDSIVVVWGCMD